MPYYKLGEFIRRRRQELGYTQEDLADGICAVNTLSRIENGERLPRKEHLEMLFQRLGCSDSMFSSYTDEKEFQLHELKYDIRQAFILNQVERARVLLDEYAKLANPTDPIARQFILLCRSASEKDLSSLERLQMLEEAIQLTCSDYSCGRIPSQLSYEEIMIINHIAVRKAELGNLDVSIDLLYSLKRYYDKRISNIEETLRSQTMVLSNLSKFLGQAGRYDECIEICDQVIRISRETGKCRYLDKVLYNKAWALVKRNRGNDKLVAREALSSAVNMATLLGHDSLLPYFEEFLHDNYDE